MILPTTNSNFVSSAKEFCKRVPQNTVLILMLIGFSAGCVSVPEASPDTKTKALAFAPPPGKAAIYVMRPLRLTGLAWPFAVSLDYTELGSMNANSYLYAVVTPGKHLLHLPNASASGTPFVAAVGKNYFFTIKPKWVSTSWFDQIEESAGMDLVMKYKLSGDTRFELQENHGQTK